MEITKDVKCGKTSADGMLKGDTYKVNKWCAITTYLPKYKKGKFFLIHHLQN